MRQTKMGGSSVVVLVRLRGAGGRGGGSMVGGRAGNGVLNLVVLKTKAHQTNVQHQNQTSMCRLNVSSG